MIKYILIALLIIPATSFGSQEVQEWWDNEYKQSIEPQQLENVERTSDRRCEDKLDKLEEKTTDYPDDAYFKWQYDLWLRKCGY